MSIAKIIHKISDIANKVCGILCVAMLISMVVITSAQIISRVFFTALTWSEEATNYLLVWSTFIGGSVVYKHSGHISITMAQDLFPESYRKLLKVLVHVICGVFCVVAIVFGFRYMKMQGSQLSAALRIPMRLMYMAIPVGFSIIELHAIDAIITMFEKSEKAEEVAV